MRIGQAYIFLFLFLVASGLSNASAQKVAAQNPAQTGIPQMPGDNGKLGTIYKMGAKGSELLFTLDSASVTTRFPAPDDEYIAGEHQRLLVLNFSVQNALLKEQSLSSSTFKFTVVSPDDENFEFRGYLLHGTKKTHFEQSLKQAQKVKCTVVVPIHDSGEVPKVIVQRGDNPVLRYDLTGKIPRMTGVFSHRNSLDLFPESQTSPWAQVNDIDGFDVSITSFAYTTEKIFGYAPPSGDQYLVVTMSFKNMMLRPIPIGFQYFSPELMAENSKEIVWNRTLLGETTDEYFNQQVNPGDTVKGRYYFVVPANVVPKVLKFRSVKTKRALKYFAPPK